MNKHEVKKIITELSPFAQKKKIQDGGNSIESMIKVLNEQLDSQLGSDTFRSNLTSVKMFLEHMVQRANELKERVDIAKKDESLFDEVLQRTELYSLMSALNNKLDGLISSIRHQVLNVITFKNGKYSEMAKSVNKLTNLKNKFSDNINNKTFDGMKVNPAIMTAFFGGKTKRGLGVRKTISVDGTGITTMFGGKEVKLIEVTKDGIRFTNEATLSNQSKDIKLLFEKLGIPSSTKNIRQYITNNNKAFPIIGKHITKYSNIKGERQTIAEGMYYMYSSLQQWAELYNLQNQYQEALDSSDQLTAEEQSYWETQISEAVENMNGRGYISDNSWMELKEDCLQIFLMQKMHRQLI